MHCAACGKRVLQMANLWGGLVWRQPEVIHLHCVSSKGFAEGVMAAPNTGSLPLQAVQLSSLLVSQRQACILILLACIQHTLFS